MADNSYTFARSDPYRAKENDEVIIFYLERSYSFTWKGKAMDRIGKFQLRYESGSYYFDIDYNYARDATYKLTVLSAPEGVIDGFVLLDDQGRTKEFWKGVRL